LCASQQHHIEAQTLFEESLSVARQIYRKDVQFQAQLWLIRLSVSLQQSSVPAAMRELESLLQEWPDVAEQAAIQYEIWRLDQTQEARRQRVTALYHDLYTHTPHIEYRQRYEELTGEHLPDPPALPELPAIVTQDPVDLEALLAEVDHVIAGLSSVTERSTIT
jgi:hypothetical protein